MSNPENLLAHSESLFQVLRNIAPTVVFSLDWSPDNDTVWESEYGEQEDLMSYIADVSVVAILEGVMVKSNIYLGDCWEVPGDFDEDIGGYLPQMLKESADNLLREQLSLPLEIRNQLLAATIFLSSEMTRRWKKQQEEKIWKKSEILK